MELDLVPIPEGVPPTPPGTCILLPPAPRGWRWDVSPTARIVGWNGGAVIDAEAAVRCPHPFDHVTLDAELAPGACLRLYVTLNILGLEMEHDPAPRGTPAGGKGPSLMPRGRGHPDPGEGWEP